MRNHSKIIVVEHVIKFNKDQRAYDRFDHVPYGAKQPRDAAELAVCSSITKTLEECKYSPKTQYLMMNNISELQMVDMEGVRFIPLTKYPTPP